MGSSSDPAIGGIYILISFFFFIDCNFIIDFHRGSWLKFSNSSFINMSVKVTIVELLQSSIYVVYQQIFKCRFKTNKSPIRERMKSEIASSPFVVYAKITLQLA